MSKAAIILGLLAVTGCNQHLSELHKAARLGDTGSIAALIRDGADPDERGGVNGWTPLMHAIHKNQLGAVIALLDAGSDPNARGSGGGTALMMAAGYGQTEIVRALLARGADPRIETPGGGSALNEAISGTADIDRFTLGACQTETVRALLEDTPELRWHNTLAGRASLLTARIGGCGEVIRMVERRQRD